MLIKNKSKPMQQVMIRLPDELREQAKTLAKNYTSEGERFFESDVYRTAIILFLRDNFTDSKVNTR